MDVPSLLPDELSLKAPGEPSVIIRDRVLAARTIQAARYAERPEVVTNAGLCPRDMKQYCTLDTEAQDLLKAAVERLGLSARAYDRVLKVARTIADLDAAERLSASHIAEALQYRRAVDV